MSPTDVSAIDDVRIDGINDLVAPNEIMARYPASEAATALIRSTRGKIADIMRGADERLLVVIGPCSIHDADAALDYATRLMGVREQYADTLEIVMRTYFESHERVWAGRATSTILISMAASRLTKAWL